jgi:hypothetical protein
VKALRRALVPSLAVLLAASAGMVVHPAASADEGLIYVSLLPNRVLHLEAHPSLVGFGATEELVISAEPGYTIIQFRDDAQPSGLGWPIVQAGNMDALNFCNFGLGGIGPNGTGRGANVVCSRADEIQVDFRLSSVNTLVAIEARTNVPLVFQGGSGPDEVYGGRANDILLGHGGNDSLFGGPGDDYLAGGPGDDYLEGESGRDDMVAGQGRDSIDAADGTADFRVDCGGITELLDFDKGLDVPTNCGANPTPTTPAPLETTLEPGEIEVTIDGVPTVIKVVPDTGGEGVRIELGDGVIRTGLVFDESGDLVFPNAKDFEAYLTKLWANSTVEFYAWVRALRGETADGSERRLARAKHNPLATFKVDARGIAEGSVPLPAGQKPGDFTLQINAVTADGAQLSVNVGVVLSQATPTPDPGPTETIAITSAKRGKGKKAAVITVTGTTTGLAGKSVTPRYRVKGAKKWVLGKPVTVTANGSFTWRHTSAQAISITMTSGAITSKPVTVAAARR